MKEGKKRNININFPGINIRTIQSQRDYQSIICHWKTFYSSFKSYSINYDTQISHLKLTTSVCHIHWHIYVHIYSKIALWKNRSITHRAYYPAKSIIHSNPSRKHRLLSSSAFRILFLHHDDRRGDTSRIFVLTLIINSFQQKSVTFHIDEKYWCNKYVPWALTISILI
jgi:hypothetical protein